jgi:hypothetical protein
VIAMPYHVTPVAPQSDNHVPGPCAGHLNEAIAGPGDKLVTPRSMVRSGFCSKACGTYLPKKAEWYVPGRKLQSTSAADVGCNSTESARCTQRDQPSL